MPRDGARVGTVGPSVLVPWGDLQSPVEYDQATLTILHARRRDGDFDRKPINIHDEMNLSTYNLLCDVIAAKPPVSVVLVDWLSTITAEGIEARPRRSVQSPWSSRCMDANFPWRPHERNAA